MTNPFGDKTIGYNSYPKTESCLHVEYHGSDSFLNFCVAVNLSLSLCTQPLKDCVAKFTNENRTGGINLTRMDTTVAVCIVTYNQEAFIGQCIESVLVQQTDFNIMMFISDDASSDSTYDICRRYRDLHPGRINLTRNDHNLGLVANTMKVLQSIQASGCDYVALLDGDDYWIDPLKITKQVSFLENNPKYGLVHTRIKGEKEEQNIIDGDVSGSILYYLEKHMRNCTVLFRSELLNLLDFQEISRRGFMVCDWIMYTIFSKSGTWFKYLNEETACWRTGHESVSNQQSFEKAVAYQENGLLQWQYLFELFPEEFPDVLRKASVYKHLKMLDLAYRFNRFGIAHDLMGKVPEFQGFKKSIAVRLKEFAAKTKPTFMIMYALLKIKKALKST